MFTWVACSHTAANAAPISNVTIGFASSTMSSLSRIWKDKRLTTATKVHLYQALVMSVLLYAAETWTLLAANLRSLEAFHQYEMPATDLRYSLDWPYLQRACLVAYRSHVSRRENCQPLALRRNIQPYCQARRGGSSPAGSPRSRRPIT